MKTETKRSNKEGSGVDFTTQFKIFNERFSIPATSWLTLRMCLEGGEYKPGKGWKKTTLFEISLNHNRT